MAATPIHFQGMSSGAGPAPAGKEAQIAAEREEGAVERQTELVESLMHIRVGDTVRFRGADDWSRLMDVRPGHTIRVGRKFVTIDPVIGQRYGTVFEEQDGSLVAIEDTELIPGAEEDAPGVDEVSNNTGNADFDPRSQAQQLDESTVLGMRDALKGEEMVRELAKNNDTFERRTEFSRAKYLRRKRKKYLNRVQALRVTPTALAEETFHKAPQKLCHMRWDMLGQMVAAADVQAGCRVLVLEQTGGTLTGMILQRLGGQGSCFHVYEGVGAPVGNARRSVRKAWINNTLRALPVSWLARALARRRRVNQREYAFIRRFIKQRYPAASGAAGRDASQGQEGEPAAKRSRGASASAATGAAAAAPPPAVSAVEEEEEEGDAVNAPETAAATAAAVGDGAGADAGDGDGEEEEEEEERADPYRDEEGTYAELGDALSYRDERGMPEEERLALKERRRSAVQWALAHGTDSLLACVNSDLMPILQALLPLVRPGGKIAMCTQSLEPLVAAQQWLQQSKLALDVNMSEFLTREYQVLPGRTHPKMNTSGHSGYMLTAIKCAEPDAPGAGPPELAERGESMMDALDSAVGDGRASRKKKQQAMAKKRKGQRVSLKITARR